MTVDPTSPTLAHLATTLPGASRVFARHRLDFCCHGDRPLADACRERDLDPASVRAEIEAERREDETFDRWDERPLAELIDHVLERYHAAHREELPRLVAMAQKVEAVHAERPDRPVGLHAHLVGMADELESHMQKEEQILFPLLRAGRGALAQAPIQVMETEHEDHARNLELTRSLTHDLTPPEDACGTWRALYLGLEELETEIMRHVHLENHVLFPRAVTE
ncbi:MAG: iron-sulfur cluster repair protein YtfE [Planctomycetota bacterium JB042]